MLDTVEVHIPFLERYCQPVPASKKWEIVHCVSELDRGLDISARHVIKRDGKLVNISYFHRYDSIPTSHSGIGYKVMHVANNCLPYVVLNASIAKIQQGHNVYGNTDMISGICEMLGTFTYFHESLCKYLDFDNIRLARFDVTLPAQAPSRTTAERIREYFRCVDWGRFRNLSVSNKRLEHNTLYFGAIGSKVGGFKIYCKGVELDNVLSDLTTQANKGSLKAVKDLEVYTQDVIDFANKSVRIEATVKKRMLTEHNLPTNLWQFLLYQLQHPTIYQKLFTIKTKEFLQSLEGMRMPYDDDIKVYDMLIKRLATPTPAGNISHAKAKNAYMFYKAIKQDGFYETKKMMHERTFRRNIKALCDAGFNRAYLQNLTKSDDTQVIRLLNLDFNAPLPSSYIPPVSGYFKQFEQYLLNAA